MRGGLTSLGQQLAAVGSGLADTFLRDNKLIPPVLALLALLVVAWIVAGIFVGSAGEDQATNRANLAQSEDPAEGQDPPTPEIENRNVESYAAFQSKDPFRQLLEPGESTTATTPPTQDTSGDDETTGRRPGRDPLGATDSDGLSDRKKSAPGLNSLNPDTGGDVSGAGRGGGDAGATGRDGAGGNHGTGRTGGLFDSGGNLFRP
jgi:hypothetical protein